MHSTPVDPALMGRPRKTFDEEDHETLKQAIEAKLGLRRMTRQINNARRERFGEEAETVSHWRVQRELKDLGYQYTTDGYVLHEVEPEVEDEVQSTPEYQSLPEVLTSAKTIEVTPAPTGIPWPAIMIVALAAVITIGTMAWIEYRHQPPEPEGHDTWFQPMGWYP